MKDASENAGPKEVVEVAPARTPTEDEQLQININEGTAEVNIPFFLSYFCYLSESVFSLGGKLTHASRTLLQA